MTELYTCTDCEAEVDFDDRREHLRTEHGVNYVLDDRAVWHPPLQPMGTTVCPDCTDTEPCERAKALEGQAVG
jgi:hypothetical protein